MLKTFPLIAAASAVVTGAAAQSPPAKPRPPACASAEHRQFDFWLGQWEVRKADGGVAGENRISRIQDGCVLLEEWRGNGGVTGTSLNVYDADRRRWHQTWVDNQGGLLVLEGAFADGRMTLSGETVDASGKRTLQRITWTPQDGGVRQLWEVSSDAGKTWSVAFDGRYTRRSP